MNCPEGVGLAPRLCFFGTYPRPYTVSRILEQAARVAGFCTHSCHYPVWEREPVKVERFFRARQLAAYAKSYLRAAAYLRTCGRSCPAEVWIFGFQGQLDLLFATALGLTRQRVAVFAPLVTLVETLVVDRKLLPADSLGARALGWLDRKSLERADRIVVDTQAHAQFLQREFGVASEKIRVFHIGFDWSVFQQVPRAPGGDTTKVLFYGSFLPLHGVNVILDAASRLRAQTGIRFTLCGEGWEHGIVLERLRSEPLPNVRLLPWVRYEELPELIAQHDVCLGAFSGGEKASMVVPNKVYQCAAVGRAVVTADSAAVREVLEHGVSVFTVPPEDPEALADAIRLLHSDAGLRARLAAQAAQTMQEQFSSVAQAQRFRRAFIDGLV